MAKYYECTVSGRGDELDHPKALGTAISHMCGDPLVKYGVQALADCDADRVTDALEEIVLGIIVSTGYVSNLVNIDLTTGAAHAMYNGFTVLPQIEHNGHLHGEIVAYGVLVLLAMASRRKAATQPRVQPKMGFHLLPNALPMEIWTIHTKALAGIDVRHTLHRDPRTDPTAVPGWSSGPPKRPGRIKTTFQNSFCAAAFGSVFLRRCHRCAILKSNQPAGAARKLPGQRARRGD